ncbi:MAG: hypothetical protein MH252_07675 [Thermosynechococcaceae cyanobacterium MS004]|nr:hypothetical protein [Thermosynechococcaceae cyanobacterium MS004]
MNAELSRKLEANAVIVDDENTIREMLDSKGSTSWGMGQEIEDDWIELARLSPQCKGDLPTIFVCEKSVYSKHSRARLLDALNEGVDYEALDAEGHPYWRKALSVGELPVTLRSEALKAMCPIVEKIIGQSLVFKICFGTPVYQTFGLRLADAKRHAQAKLLLSKGTDLPLSLLTEQVNYQGI